MRNMLNHFNFFYYDPPMHSHNTRSIHSIGFDSLIQKPVIISALSFLFLCLEINADTPQAVPVVTPEVAHALSLTQKTARNKLSYWRGKKIVWFGTSIPAGVVNAGESGGNGSYPERIGEILGATVYNESVGSSRVRAGNHIVRTDKDPFGWSGMSPTGILYSLSLSSKEKRDIHQ